MKINNIDTLLKSFYDGSTTIDEEKMLKEYFLTANNIPHHLKADKELFANLSKDKIYVAPLEMEQRIETFIDTWAEKEKKKHIGTRKFNRLWISGIAAGIALLIISTVMYIYNDNSADNLRTDTYSDVNIAYTEAEKALLLVSETLNKGEAQYAKAESKIDKINEILNKNLNK